MTQPELIKPNLELFDAALEEFKQIDEQFDQKAYNCLHANGPWPTEADNQAWLDAKRKLDEAGDALREAAENRGE